MLLRRSQRAESRSAGGITTAFGIEFLSKPANIFRLVIDNGKHPAEEEQVARLQSFHVAAEGRRRPREFDAEVPQPALDAASLGAFVGYQLHTCTPTSPCNTSLVERRPDPSRCTGYDSGPTDCHTQLQ
jgi:hypothetical protein